MRVADDVVLVVDDNPDSRKRMKSILENSLGISTVLASTGKEALQRVQDLRPRLVLLDVRLPKVDGLEVIRRLKMNLSTRRIPVIAIGGSESRNLLRRAMTAGYDDVLSPPFEADELERKVRDFLRVVHR